MNKSITMFLAFVCSAVMIMPFSLPSALAEEGMTSATDGMRKKRYRYRKRALRVQVGADVTPWSKVEDKDGILFKADLLAGYNFGYFEIGPNVNLKKDVEDFKKTEVEAGLWGEFNFLKNTRKQKVVPALGAKVNYKKPKTGGNELLLSPYLALKYFPASRTGLVLNVDVEIVQSLQNLSDWGNIDMGVDVSLAYVHYFHL